MITWKPCQTSACVQTGTDEAGRVYIRSTVSKAADAIEAARAALDAHRWKSMGVSSVQCECGEILYGDESLTQFPADEAFRRHLAEAVLVAASPLGQVRFTRAEWDAYLDSIRREERQRIIAYLVDVAAGMGYEKSELFTVAWPHLADVAADLLDGDGDE